MDTTEINKELFFNAVHDKTTIKGFTHDFYNYPARFSPILAREIIKTFSKPGDLIIDPFMGGGTTLVEAKLLNRDSIGFDISSLATFITKTKITAIKFKELTLIKTWAHDTVSNMNCHIVTKRPSSWIKKGYQKNISNRSTWPIRKMIEHFIYQIDDSALSNKQKNFLRCCVLKTGQWALDNKKNIPPAINFREKLLGNIDLMCIGASQFYNRLKETQGNPKTFCINRPSSDIEKISAIKKMKAPSLILTSPPYPGIHVVYHRWQVNGKRETPAPFWIANSLDGHGESHYTMGSRSQEGLKDYFTNIYTTFNSIKNICDKKTLIVQVLAFSDPTWQLQKYLETMTSAGFSEVQLDYNRFWRDVPNRKWYAQQKGATSSSKEVLLFHKLTP